VSAWLARWGSGAPWRALAPRGQCRARPRRRQSAGAARRTRFGGVFQPCSRRVLMRSIRAGSSARLQAERRPGRTRTQPWAWVTRVARALPTIKRPPPDPDPAGDAAPARACLFALATAHEADAGAGRALQTRRLGGTSSRAWATAAASMLPTQTARPTRSSRFALAHSAGG
jgi:hypothetical protein